MNNIVEVVKKKNLPFHFVVNLLHENIWLYVMRDNRSLSDWQHLNKFQVNLKEGHKKKNDSYIL